MHSFLPRISGLLLLCTLSLFSHTSMAATPLVITTIKPLHSLASFIMQGVGKPRLLIQDNQSIHDYRIRPSQRRMLAKGDIIIYASPHVETFIPSLKKNMPHKQFIDLSAIPGLRLLDARASHPRPHQQADKDGHIWLSTSNALVIAEHISRQLSRHDPQHATDYTHNLKKIRQRLLQLRQQIQEQLQGLRGKPFLLFHDAFQYFEKEFQLNQGLFVTSSADHKMGIKYISSLKQRIEQYNIHCVYYEPPHIPPLIYTLTAGRKIQLLPLDPLAMKISPGAELYFQHMQQIAAQFQHCLDS